MVSIRSPPEWGIEPIQSKYRSVTGRSYFILWSSLGVGLLVFSAGSLLTGAKFSDAILAIIIGSLVGSLLLAVAGKIGSDHAVPSLVSMRPSFGVRGSYLPAILNIIQLIGWTTFEIMIMSKASEMLVGNHIPYYIWTIMIGAFVILLGIVGPLTVLRQWLEKFAIWIVYASSTLIIINLLMSGTVSKLILSASGTASGLSFFSALDIVIAMPISWMPLVSDYNRFAKNSRGSFFGTFVGFAITNILFYFGGLILGVSDVIGVVAAIQSIFFGLILLMFILHETSNAFADVYSAAVSTQSIYHKIKQRYLIIGFTVLSIVLAIIVPISQYETFLLLIGAVFVPLFGIVISDYYIVKDRHYETKLMYGSSALSIGFPAIIAWSFGVLIYYLFSSISPIYISQWPQIGSTIPSFIGSSLLYLGIMKINSIGYLTKIIKG